MRRLAPLLILACLTANATAQATTPAGSLLSRHYHDGDRVEYHMTATNQQGPQTISYEADANGAAIEDASGTWHEEIGWSNLIWNHQAIALAPSAANFRELLSRALADGAKSKQRLPPACEIKWDEFHVDPALAAIAKYASPSESSETFFRARPWGQQNPWNKLEQKRY